MRRIHVRATAILVIITCICASNTWALWGKAETKTEDGNAKMNLPDYKGLRHAIGVTDFKNESGWSGRWKLGYNLGIMLESALFDTGRFVIIERQKLDTIMKEQDLQASGRMAKAKRSAKTGVIRSARYIARGSVVEVTENQSGGKGGIRIRGIRLGGGKSEAQIAIIAKLIDTTTSEIVAKQRIVGKAGSTRLNVGLSLKGMSTDMGGFKKTPLAQAAQDCINKASKFIATAMEEFPFEGSVIKTTSSGQAIINRGSSFGVETGQILIAAEEGEVLIDPDTGEVLDREEGKVIAKLKVARVKEKVSYCDIIDGNKKLPKGTVVKAE